MVEKVLELNREKAIFWALFGVFALCAGFYMYFINATVRNIVLRQNLENEASGLTLKIGSQEFEYITKRNSVTLSLARSLGFEEAGVRAYVTLLPDTKMAYLSP